MMDERGGVWRAEPAQLLEKRDQTLGNAVADELERSHWSLRKHGLYSFSQAGPLIRTSKLLHPCEPSRKGVNISIPLRKTEV